MRKLYQNIKALWFSISLKQKLGLYTIMMVLVMGQKVNEKGFRSRLGVSRRILS